MEMAEKRAFTRIRVWHILKKTVKSFSGKIPMIPTFNVMIFVINLDELSIPKGIYNWQK
jgi:hypothetical protein